MKRIELLILVLAKPLFAHFVSGLLDSGILMFFLLYTISTIQYELTGEYGVEDDFCVCVSKSF